jgi:hypothetical protein
MKGYLLSREWDQPKREMRRDVMTLLLTTIENLEIPLPAKSEGVFRG